MQPYIVAATKVEWTLWLCRDILLFVCVFMYFKDIIDNLVQDCSNSSTLAMELL